MAKTITLTFDLDTKQVEGESAGYSSSTCDLELGSILSAVGKDKVKRTRKDDKLRERERVKS